MNEANFIDDLFSQIRDLKIQLEKADRCNGELLRKLEYAKDQKDLAREEVRKIREALEAI